MLDYHLHLVPHGDRRRFTVEDVRAYAARAGAAGLREIAVTEHLYRFPDVQDALGPWWDVDDDPTLRDQTARYHAAERFEQTLAEYVDVVLEAAASLPAGAPAVRLGLEVDYVPHHMEAVAAMLAGHPFDVLLGSVHWVGAFGFDQVGDPVVDSEWRRRDADGVWLAYVAAVEQIAGTAVCDVLAHVDLAKVAGVLPAHAGDECDERLVKAAAGNALHVEVNTAGWRKAPAEPYPSPRLLAALRDAGVGVTLASDAHDQRAVGDRVADALALVRDVGYREVAAFERRRPSPLPIDDAATSAGGG